jgi:DNA-binding GntR family transcriptional regulator
LRELVDLQRQVPENEWEQFIELDERFHRTMAESAGKSKAWDVIANMKAHLDRVRYLSTTQKPMQRLADQHQAVVEAIASGDTGKAEKAIRGHLREVLADLPKVMSARPEMFDEND